VIKIIYRIYNNDREIKYMNKEVIIIKADRKSKYHKTLHKTGTVINCTSGSELGVKIDGLYNDASNKGLFWFKPYEIEFVDKYEENNGGKNDMYIDGKYRIAVVNLVEDRYNTDYGFALYDENVKVGDCVITNPQNKLTLSLVKSIVTQEEYGKGVTKEVVGLIDMSGYKARVEDRERAVKIEKEKKELQRELDKKISKLKDLEFYERMAKELSDKDPEIVAMVNKLKELG